MLCLRFRTKDEKKTYGEHPTAACEMLLCWDRKERSWSKSETENETTALQNISLELSRDKRTQE